MEQDKPTNINKYLFMITGICAFIILHTVLLGNPYKEFAGYHLMTAPIFMIVGGFAGKGVAYKAQQETHKE